MFSMIPKTPEFDKAIKAILADLKPHDRKCGECGGEFRIEPEDIEFLKKFSVPSPTLCPACRLRRKLAYRINMLPVFYKKSCAAPGHSEKVLAFYPEDNPIPVYDDSFYLSDKWDPISFGIDFSPGAPFFEEFYKFAVKVPHQTLQRDPRGIGCEYTISGLSSKNCYIATSPIRSENVYYARLPVGCRDSLDIHDVDNSEWCYEGVRLSRCYGCFYSTDLADCVDSYFLFDCVNCQNCFGCTNLRNKKYCFLNEQLSKDDYEDRMSKIDLGSRRVVERWRDKFRELENKAIRKNLKNIKVNNVFGNELENCENCQIAFRVFGGSKNIRHTVHVESSEEIMDVFGASDVSFLYESTAVAPGNNVKFSIMIRNGVGMEYCMECNDCQNCFGCLGLRSKKYCIFNKQYSEEEYWARVDKIKTEMLGRGEYGEFFPIHHSFIAYNDSNAGVEFPLTKEEVLKRGWRWQDQVESEVDLSKIEILKPKDVPDNIVDVGEDILGKAIICEKTGKPFRITKYELDFYRKQGIPIPVEHPFERMRRRLKQQIPFRLWQTICSKCNKEIYSGYNPENKFVVYCEECYQKEVL